MRVARRRWPGSRMTYTSHEQLRLSRIPVRRYATRATGPRSLPGRHHHDWPASLLGDCWECLLDVPVVTSLVANHLRKDHVPLRHGLPLVRSDVNQPVRSAFERHHQPVDEPMHRVSTILPPRPRATGGGAHCDALGPLVAGAMEQLGGAHEIDEHVPGPINGTNAHPG